jgi:hypothetical protein
MSETESLGTAEYSYPLKKVFLAAKTALAVSGSFDLVKIDEVGNRLILESRASLNSWGEIVSIEFSTNTSKGTFVRVQSSFKRNTGSSGKVGANRNQRNVNQVISLISEELARVSSVKAPTKPIKQAVKTKAQSNTVIKDNPYATTWKVPPLAKQYAYIGIAGVVILVMALAVQGMRPVESSTSPTPSSAPTPNYVPKPTPTTSKAPSKPKPKRTTSVAQCSEAATAVTMVRNVFSDGSATPNQVSSILNEAARMWSKEAQSASGSKREWLSKMAELARDVDSYLITGSPANGATKFDQLFANMGLVNNFCN